MTPAPAARHPLPDHLPILDARIRREGLRTQYVERELTVPVDLCDARRRLNPEAVGWSRQPLVRANLRGHWLRKKRWNFWNWIDPGFVLSVTLADIDYAAFCAFFFVDFETGEKTEGMWLGRPGRFALPEHVERSVTVHEADVRYDNLVEDGRRHVVLDAPGSDGRHVRADFVQHVPSGQESLNVVVPWSRTRFQLNSKHNTLPCEGTVDVGGRVYTLDPARTHAVQDWGRGVWPYRAFWNWAVCTGEQGGRRIGVNLGAKWTTGTGANENGILLDGRLHKIMEDVRWAYDPADDAALWRIRTEHSKAVDLVLEPVYAHRSRTSLGPIASGGVCCFGRWRGRIEAGGESIAIDGLPGWAEEFAHRW